MKQFKHFKGIYERGKEIYTENLVKGQVVYGEKIIREDAKEYREWDPKRSKLGAALKKEISQIGIKEDDYVLYLGASTGTTVSHVSDIVGKNGLVFALDFAPRVLRDLIFLAESRNNIAPVLADANKPETYAHLVTEVDTVFMDVAQKNQVEIFLKNCSIYLKKGGFGLLALKARSIDVTRKPTDIFKQVRKELEKDMIVADYRELEPYEIDHALFVCKKK
ncbi:MAG: fibrillarin-like rRNA methylase [Candidatus Woesearchaeota archaeon]|nr:MAG: fibrillarin-like rRNA methylase [Candidatus Woesearchaeota archaeon]